MSPCPHNTNPNTLTPRYHRELAATISKDYAGKGKVVIVGLLKGAFIFAADLCRELTIPHEMDFMSVVFSSVHTNNRVKSWCFSLRASRMGSGA